MEEIEKSGIILNFGVTGGEQEQNLSVPPAIVFT